MPVAPATEPDAVVACAYCHRRREDPVARFCTRSLCGLPGKCDAASPAWIDRAAHLAMEAV